MKTRASAPASKDSAHPRPKDGGFLPDFCSMGMVLSLLLGAQLLAIVLALYVADSFASVLDALSKNSLLILWVALASSLLLCLLRSLIHRLSPFPAGILAWLIIQLVVLAVCVITDRVAGVLLPDLTQQWFYAKSLGISSIVGALILRYLYIQHRWRQQIEAESQARLQAMQARIRPHFLFNSMNTLAELTRSNPVMAEQVVMDLSDLYRACLVEVDTGNTLRHELELARGYLRIEQQRLGDRLVIDWELEDLPLDSWMPALILQPLVENAVYHGIEPAITPGLLKISGKQSGQEIYLTILNTLPENQATPSRAGNHMALENTRQRLQAFFKGRADLQVTQLDGHYQVELHFPVKLSKVPA